MQLSPIANSIAPGREGHPAGVAFLLFLKGYMKALALGCLLPTENWVASVESCGKRAIALKHSDEAGVSIVASIEDMDSRAIALGDCFVKILKHVKRGDFLTFNGDALKNDNGFIVYTKDAYKWDPRPELSLAGNIKNKKHVIMLIEKYLKALCKQELDKDGIRGKGAFGDAFKSLTQSGAFPANLVGFGPGSTPAGDDWLAAYLTAMDAMLGEPGSAERSLRHKLRSALGRTNFSGKSLLMGCIEGCPPAYLARLALAAIKADEEEIAAAVKNALGHGASSGRDSMDGFIYALGNENT